MGRYSIANMKLCPVCKKYYDRYLDTKEWPWKIGRNRFDSYADKPVCTRKCMLEWRRKHDPDSLVDATNYESLGTSKGHGMYDQKYTIGENDFWGTRDYIDSWIVRHKKEYPTFGDLLEHLVKNGSIPQFNYIDEFYLHCKRPKDTIYTAAGAKYFINKVIKLPERPELIAEWEKRAADQRLGVSKYMERRRKQNEESSQVL